jgi:two-component system cell cycle sensor histidine kinase PleC
MLGLELDRLAALSGVTGRGAVAFALAGLLTLASSRRRKGMPAPEERESYSQLASAIPMGLACWTGTGQLIVCNDQYRNRLDLDDPSVTYHQAVSRLIAGGYMKLVREDHNLRLLELHCGDGTCLQIDERPLGEGAFMTLVSDITEVKRTDAMLQAIREEQDCWPAAITKKSSRPRRRAAQRPISWRISATTSAHRSTTLSALPS